MKKVFKIFGYLLLAATGLLAAGAAFIEIRGIPKQTYAPTPEIASLEVPKGDTVRIQRGKKIASMLCCECHRGDDGKMSGSPRTDLPPMFGHLASLNITNDSIHGIGGWTDGEIYYFLRTGIRKNGQWAPPFMPKYPHMADEDVKSIIAWLRSDDPLVAPSQREYPANEWNFFNKFLANTVVAPPPLPQGPIPVPPATDKVALGRYLADGVFGCYQCHSGDLVKLDNVNPPNSFRYYGGGNPLLNLEGQTVMSANITMHPENGIGRWTEEQFIQAVKYGKKPDGTSLNYPMAPHTALEDNEIRAIFAYLKTIPVIDFKVDRYKP